MNRRYFEFGQFRIDMEGRALWRGSQIVQLTPKAFDTLAALVERRGEVVSRNELIRAVWPDTFVGSGNLNSNIFALRRALNERAGEENFIATVPRRGYRFIAEIRQTADQPDLPCPEGSVAVLPLKAISNDESDRCLGLGIADALITRLSDFEQIIIRPTSAVRRYLDSDADPVAAGRELCVRSVVEGSIHRQGDRLRITIQLISVDKSAMVWAGVFDENIADIFAVEDIISERIAAALALNQTGLSAAKEKTLSAGAQCGVAPTRCES